MSVHIKKFIDRLQHFESRGVKEFNCDINDAKNLHRDITRLLLELNELKERPVAADPEVVTVELDGGSF